MPYAGGGASIFRSWSSSLPASVEVCPIQLPGRETRHREQPFVCLHRLVESLTDGFSPWLDKPFGFFGHSLGGIVSFELSCRLVERFGIEPIHLFVSGCEAPQIPRIKPITYDLPDREFIMELRRLNGIPKEVWEQPELLQLILPTLRADFAVIQNYVYHPRPKLDCPITAFGGMEDEEVRLDQIKAWSRQSVSSFKMHLLPGNHFFLHFSQPLLLQLLSEELLKISAATKIQS